MTPDRGFTKQLKMIGKDLDVVWDWGSAKWEIWEFPSDGREGYHVLTVQTKGKTYRDLGADILLKLQQWDPLKVGAKEIMDYLEEGENQRKRRKAKEFKDKIDAMARETFSYIHVVMGKPIKVPKSRVIEEAVGWLN